MISDVYDSFVLLSYQRGRGLGVTALYGSYKQTHQGIPNFKGLNKENGMVRFKKADPHVKKETRFLPKN